jgi:ergothioneine biosynthesis protein EgtB
MTPEAAARREAVRGDETRADQYREVRALTLSLVATLSPEDCVVQSMPDASPAKWHLAHTTWFFETFVVEPALPGYRVFHPQFRFLFNSYYNSIGAQYPRPERGLLTRPSLPEVREYRAHVDRAVAEMFASGRVDAELDSRIELGLHHEQQHQELILTDVKHLLSANPMSPAYREISGSPARSVTPVRWLRHAGGTVRIGHEGQGFAFDNERPRHRTLVEPFELATRAVSNGDFLDFVDDGGYRKPELWLSDGWATVQSQGWCAPLYWRGDHADRSVFTLGGHRDIRLDEPVCHVSYYEADAFARWAGARLPTEAEWETIASDLPIEGNFLDLDRLHPAPPLASASSAPAQLFGDVWEWTQSAYTTYPGYRLPEGALGEYNAKFMCNQLVLRGGSCATPRGHVRASYRNFFPPSARWQFSGIRLARDA